MLIHNAEVTGSLLVNGNVGIGTPTPSTKLSLGISDVIGEIGRIGFDVVGNQRAYIAANRHTAPGQLSDLSFGTMDTERMRINSTGNVGIGATNPLWQTTLLQNISGGGNTRYGGTIVLSRFIDTLTNQRSSAIYHYYNGDTTDMLAFSVDNSGTKNPALIANAQMVLTNSGNVGISGSITSLSNSDELSLFAGTTVIDNRARIELYGPSHATLPNQTFIRGSQIIFTSDAATTERMRISSSGNVLIGTSTEVGARLHINGPNNDVFGQLRITTSGAGSDAQITFGTNSNGRGLYVDDSDVNKLKIYGGGGKGISEVIIDNVGNLSATSYSNTSDERLKNIIDRDYGMVTYQFKNSPEIHYGYIAQEMLNEYPNQVQQDKNGYYSLNYIEILVKKVNDLEKKLNNMDTSF